MKRPLVVPCLLIGLVGCTPQETDCEAKNAALQSFDSPAALMK
jgi:hypothetical protein